MQKPTITIINNNTLSVITDDDAEPQIISRHSAGVCNINFGSSEVQRFFWDYLRSLATSAPIVADEQGTLDAVIQSILNRLEALEGGARIAAKLHQDINSRLAARGIHS